MRILSAVNMRCSRMVVVDNVRFPVNVAGPAAEPEVGDLLLIAGWPTDAELAYLHMRSLDIGQRNMGNTVTIVKRDPQRIEDLYEQGGEYNGLTGISGRRMVIMPDGAVYEEGLGDRGDMYRSWSVKD